MLLYQGIIGKWFQVINIFPTIGFQEHELHISPGRDGYGSVPILQEKHQHHRSFLRCFRDSFHKIPKVHHIICKKWTPLGDYLEGPEVEHPRFCFHLVKPLSCEKACLVALSWAPSFHVDPKKGTAWRAVQRRSARGELCLFQLGSTYREIGNTLAR